MSCVFYGENTLDKSLFRRSCLKNMLTVRAFLTQSISLMTVSVVLALTVPDFWQ